MSRTYALQMLLAHGELTFPEIVEITKWNPKACSRTLEQLIGWKSVKKIGKRRGYIYALT